METACVMGRNPYPQEFEDLWSIKPNRGPNNNKRAAYRCYKARLKQGYSHQEIYDGVMGYKEYCRKTGRLNTEFTMMLSTIIGPDCHFDNDWQVQDSLPSDDEALEASAARS